MPTKTLYLDQEFTKPIIMHWGWNWRNFTVTQEGAEIGQFKNEKELRKGQAFLLAEDKTLSIKLNRKWGYLPELEVLLNGIPVPGSGTESREQIKQVYHLLLFLAFFNAGLGLIADLANITLLQGLGLGFGTVVIGLLYGLFAYLVQYKHSLVALYISIGIMLLDTLLVIAFAGKSENNLFSGIMMKLFFIMLLFNGVKALKKLKSEAGLTPTDTVESVSY